MKKTAIIITIGDELLIGQTIDTNSAWIGKELNKRGINISRKLAIADEKTAIADALDECITKCDLLILTGGLGPTADDITKPLLCAYFGAKMVVNETVLRHVQQIFTKRNRPFLERNTKQAEVPDNCQVLFNRLGTAPGMWFEKGNCIILSLPGVPFEMQTILTEEGFPRLEERFKEVNHIYHKTLITLGVGESFIADKIQDIEESLPAHIHLAYLPSPGMVKLRLTAEAEQKEQLQTEVDIQAKLIASRLGEIVAATEDISAEEILARILIEKRLSLGLAESCTGGYVANLITNVSGSSAFFKGSVVSYANEVKQDVLGVSEKTLLEQGAVSEATVTQMAQQARSVLKADITVSISGILGPGGATDTKPVGLVWMAVSNKNKTLTRQFNFHYDRLRNKEMAAVAALNLVRQFVLEL